ncbi:MAG: hypothetical protein ACPG4N_03800 [Gammaproteobacteria bacterium]
MNGDDKQTSGSTLSKANGDMAPRRVSSAQAYLVYVRTTRFVRLIHRLFVAPFIKLLKNGVAIDVKFSVGPNPPTGGEKRQQFTSDHRPSANQASGGPENEGDVVDIPEPELGSNNEKGVSDAERDISEP